MSEYYKCVECSTVYTVPTASFVCNKFGCPGKGLTGLLIPITEQEAKTLVKDGAVKHDQPAEVTDEKEDEVVASTSPLTKENSNGPKPASNLLASYIILGVVILVTTFVLVKNSSSAKLESKTIPVQEQVVRGNTEMEDHARAGFPLNPNIIIGTWGGTMEEFEIYFNLTNIDSGNIVSGRDSLRKEGGGWAVRPVSGFMELAGEHAGEITLNEPGSETWDGVYTLKLALDSSGALMMNGFGDVAGKNFHKKVETRKEGQ